MKSEIPQQLMDGFQSNFDHDLFMVSKRSQMTFSLVMLGGWHFNILSTREDWISTVVISFVIWKHNCMIIIRVLLNVFYITVY